MIMESIRLLADKALGDLDEGVNAQLRALSRDPGDEVPPEIVRILDVTRDPEAIREDPPMDWPVLLVTHAGPATADGEVATNHRDAEVPFEILLLNKDPDEGQAAQDSYYTLRAIVKALREWSKNDRAEDRTRNQVSVLRIRDLVFGPVRDDEFGGLLRAAVTGTLDVRDKAP